MPNIKLPDGKSLKFKGKVTGFQIAEEISKNDWDRKDVSQQSETSIRAAMSEEEW